MAPDRFWNFFSKIILCGVYEWSYTLLEILSMEVEGSTQD
jgi:hypothetical protein